MRTATYNLNLRVGAGIPPIVKVSQNDEGRSIGFRLFDGALAYFPGATAEVTITGTKPSGLGFTETCSVSGAMATVETTLAMTQESGQINAELRISDGTLNVGTTNFVLSVEPAPHPEGTTDGTTEEARTVLEQCAQYAQEAHEAASDVAPQVESLVDAAVADKMGEIEDAVQSVTDAASQAVSDINAAGEAVEESIPADYTALSTQVSQLQADLGDISGSTRNLFNIENLVSSNITVSDGISSGTGAHYKNDHIDGIPLDFTFEENTQYVFSFKGRNVTGNGTGTGLTLYVSYTDGSTSTQIQLKNTYTDFTEVSGVSNVGKTVRRAIFSYASGGDNTWELKDFQIEKGFVQTAYTPYKTGADFSIRSEISDMGFIRTMVAKIASDNDNNLIIDKSLFEIGNITINGTGIIYNDSGTRIRTKKSRQIYIPAGYSISIDGCAFYIAYVDSTGIHFNGWISSYTTPVDGYYYMLIKFSTESTITDIDDVLDNILIIPPESIGHMLLPVSANPMRFKPVYDHLFVNDPNESIIIPHESLAHVRLSARMGFNCIEANVAGKTSDGVYIVNHLVSKKFGRYFYSLDNTDLTDVLVSSVTWDYIVQNVRYNSTLPKYRTRPCRLEEFLAECKMQNLIPFVGSDDSDVYAICDEYMGRGNYIAYGASREQQPDGIIYHWKNLSTKADILAYCQSVGKPFIYGMSNIASFTDSELLDIVQTLHAHGFWIGTSYADNSWYKYAHLGFDMLGALKRINRIPEGNVCNIDSIFGFSGFTYTNATEADGVLTFGADGTLTPTFTANTLSVGGFDLEMHFNGEIVVPTVGKHGILLYTSDGSYPVFACAPILNGSPAMALTVKSGTVVYDVSYKVSEF